MNNQINIQTNNCLHIWYVVIAIINIYSYNIDNNGL